MVSWLHDTLPGNPQFRPGVYNARPSKTMTAHGRDRRIRDRMGVMVTVVVPVLWFTGCRGLTMTMSPVVSGKWVGGALVFGMFAANLASARKAGSPPARRVCHRFALAHHA